MRNVKKILETAISPYEEYSEGYGNIGASGNGYILGVTLAATAVKRQFTHVGSQMLDEINAFDTAETHGPYIGQINMSTVSSFCGPQGLIAGYDILNSDFFNEKEQVEFISTQLGIDMPVYDIKPLIRATEYIFGTNQNRKYILRPGSHVPCANKVIKADKPSYIFSSIAVGIAKERETSACLLMENVGVIYDLDIDLKKVEIEIKDALARSQIQVGLNQKVEYERVYAGVTFARVLDDQVGCALVAAPYFTIPRKLANEVITNLCQKHQ